VFYTDNGSTGVEVALKMAFRRFMADHGLLDAHGVELEVGGGQGRAAAGRRLGCWAEGRLAA
jgi:dethiobiotin synthetase/adenosylmethionine--8-amino-7-oxononanoate aminotransferase